jgi:hypothetical protein
MKESKQVIEVKRKTSEIPMRDEELHSKYASFLQGYRVGGEPKNSSRLQTLTSHSSLFYSKDRQSLLETLLLSERCVLEWRYGQLFIVLQGWFLDRCLACMLS